MDTSTFNNLKIGYRLLFLFQITMLPTIIIFIVFMLVMNKLNVLKSLILIDNVSSITAAYNLEKSALSMKGVKAYYILDRNPSRLGEFDRSVESFRYWYSESFKSAFTEEEQDILTGLSPEFEKYLSCHRKIISLVHDGKGPSAVYTLLNESSEIHTIILDMCERLISKNKELVSESENQFRKYIRLSRYLGYTIIILFILLGVILVPFTVRNIRGRFDAMMDMMDADQKRMIISERRAAIGEIAAGISHELNNPIGIICGFADILANKPEFTEGDREMVIDIHKEAQRCRSLLKQLLDFARAPMPCYIETDMAGLVRETLNLFTSQDKYRGIHFTCIIQDSPLDIFVEPFQIKQVLLNIILNACDAVNLDGEISVSLERAGDKISISVKDSGRGISEENISRIFTPFFTTKHEGVGLGLAVCRDIIEKHNGRIEVKSGEGQGAEFVIILPEGGES